MPCSMNAVAYISLSLTDQSNTNASYACSYSVQSLPFTLLVTFTLDLFIWSTSIKFIPLMQHIFIFYISITCMLIDYLITFLLRQI